MPISQWFDKLKEPTRNRIFAGLISLLISSGYPILRSIQKDEKILRLELGIKKETGLNKKKDIELTQLKIELITCQANFGNSNSDMTELPIPAWRRSVASGFIVWCNDAFEDQVLKPLGKTKEDLIYKHDSLVFGIEGSKKYEATWRRVYETGEELRVVEPLYFADGSIVNWRSLKFPIPKNGKITHVGGITDKIE